MIRSPASSQRATIHSSIGRPCRSRRGCRGRDSVRRREAARQRAERRRRGRRGVGSGRGDDAGGERRRVETVVDRRDEVDRERVDELGRCLVAPDHAQIVGDVAERQVGIDRLEPRGSREQRRDHRGNGCGGPTDQVTAPLGLRRGRRGVADRAATPSMAIAARRAASGAAATPSAVGATSEGRIPTSVGESAMARRLERCERRSRSSGDGRLRRAAGSTPPPPFAWLRAPSRRTAGSGRSPRCRARR